MNEYDDILNRIVEEFYDTGRLVLNEIHSVPWFVKKIRGLLSKAKSNYIKDNYEEALSNYRSVLEIYNGLKDGQKNSDSMNWFDVNIPIREINRIEGLITPEDPVEDEVEVGDGLDNSEEETDEFPTEEPTSDDASTEETDEVNVYYDPDNVSPPLENKITRSRRIEKENNTELLPLSQNYSGDKESKLYKSNLNRLQYILLQSETWGAFKLSKEKEDTLKEEIKNGEFGETTDELLRKFQTHARKNPIRNVTGVIDLDSEEESYEVTRELPFNLQSDRCELIKYNNENVGKVDEWTWCKLMQVTNYREFQKLNNITNITDDDKNRVIDTSTINITDPNEEVYDDSKKDMFKSLSLKFFNNLENKKIYETTFQKQWEDLSKFFREGIDRVNKLDKLEKEREDFLASYTNEQGEFNDTYFKNQRGIDSYIKKKFDDEIEKLKEYSDRVGEEPIEFWRDYKNRWDEIEKRTDQNFDKEGKLKDLQKEYVKYRNRRSTIEGIYGKIIEELKKGLKEKKLSLNEINTILQNVNDSLYKVFDTDRQHRTQIDNAKKLLKGLFNKLSVEENVDVYDIVDFLENINVRKLSYDIYEKSFCECDGDYFTGCNKRDGDKSKLFNNAVKEIKKYLGGEYKDLPFTGASESIYDLIMEEKTTVADKYDIVSKSAVTLTNNVVIPKDKKIEVKKYVEGESYTLSEFIGLYKRRKDIEKYKDENGEYYLRYNNIIKDVVRRLNENDRGLSNSFKNETDNDNKLFGVFVDDYQFYKYDQIDLFWSIDSNQKRFKDEFRITLKFKIKDGQTPSQWVEGNCNLQQNESTDRLDEIIENFFDTGKFVF